MTSEQEAFDIFGIWKNSTTVLKLTMETNGAIPETMFEQVAALDRDASQASFVVPRTRPLLLRDLAGASFRAGKRKLEVECFDGERLTFEEVVERPKESRIM
jgi:hypothetical protein